MGRLLLASVWKCCGVLQLVTCSRNELLSIEPDILFSCDALRRPFVFLRSRAAQIETGCQWLALFFNDFDFFSYRVALSRRVYKNEMIFYVHLNFYGFDY